MGLKSEIPDDSGTQKSAIRSLKKMMTRLNVSESPSPMMVDKRRKRAARVGSVHRTKSFKKRSDRSKRVSATDFSLGDFVNESVNFDHQVSIPTPTASFVGWEVEELYFKPPELNMPDFLDQNISFY